MPSERPQVAVIGAGNWGKHVVRTFHASGALAGIGEADPNLHPALAAKL
jgi:predicted dehydrogenase